MTFTVRISDNEAGPATARDIENLLRHWGYPSTVVTCNSTLPAPKRDVHDMFGDAPDDF